MSQQLICRDCARPDVRQHYSLQRGGDVDPVPMQRVRYWCESAPDRGYGLSAAQRTPMLANWKRRDVVPTDLRIPEAGVPARALACARKALHIATRARAQALSTARSGAMPSQSPLAIPGAGRAARPSGLIQGIRGLRSLSGTGKECNGQSVGPCGHVSGC